MPIARERSSGGNVTVRIESVPGISRAAPTPWRARNMISWLPDPESPQPRDANVKIAKPARNIFLRPYRSPRMPPVSRRDANARTYPSMIHWRSETVASSLLVIVGRAMLTTVLSSIAIARAKHIVRRTMTFSLAFSPLKPSNGMVGSFLVDARCNAREGGPVP
jgi:hypothetical protein